MERKVHDAERFDGIDAVEAHFLQCGAGRRTLHGECGNFISDVRDGNVIETEGTFPEPGDTRTAAVQLEPVIRQFE